MAWSIFSITYRGASTIQEYAVPVTTSTASLLIAAYDAAVAACDPEVAVADAIHSDEGGITIGGEAFGGARPRDVVVVAIGKAAAAMVRGVVSALGPVRGLAVSNSEEDCPVPMLVGSHPVPDEASSACGEALLTFVGSLGAGDVVVYLISGGGSSIAVAPVDRVSLDDLAATNRTLMGAGVPIGEMNEVRSAVSRIKGGRLADACTAGRSVTLVLSDVVGAGPSHVASGPSIGAGMGSGAAAAITTYRLSGRLPRSVLAAVAHRSPLVVAPQPYAVVGSTEVSARAAAAYLDTCGVASHIATTDLSGEARVEAVKLVEGADAGMVTIATGETTVTVTGDGVGGRNQEGALAVVATVAGTDTTFLACGTDGIDGPTPAAGAIVDGDTAGVAKESGIDIAGHLGRNDSYPVLAALDALVMRGNTGTNVADIWMVARGIDPESSS
jgi:hydroxypyruvate reductase